MARKVFLSILGTGKYEPCVYVKDGKPMTETKFIQQALLEYLQSENIWTINDKAVVFLTAKARETHWSELEQAISKMGIAHDDVDIEDGNDNDQMWSIFETIFNQLEENDELYLDITHSFRYLPMLLIVLTNYAKLLKNCSVKAIYYGNFQVKEEQKPIMDLLPLSALQDWTSAVSDYLQYGQIKKLSELSKSSLSPILKDPATRSESSSRLNKFISSLDKAVSYRLTCRGKNVVDGSEADYLNKTAEEIKDVAIVPFRPVFEKIKESLPDFGTKQNAANCIKAAKWCLRNKMFQQSITLLEEGIKDILSSKTIPYSIVNKCIKIKTDNLDETKWDVDDDKMPQERILIRNVVNCNSGIWSNKDFIDTMRNISDLRNDYNHAGFRENPRSVQKIIVNIEECLDSIEQILKDEGYLDC